MDEEGEEEDEKDDVVSDTLPLWPRVPAPEPVADPDPDWTTLKPPNGSSLREFGESLRGVEEPDAGSGVVAPVAVVDVVEAAPVFVPLALLPRLRDADAGDSLMPRLRAASAIAFAEDTAKCCCCREVEGDWRGVAPLDLLFELGEGNGDCSLTAPPCWPDRDAEPLAVGDGLGETDFNWLMNVPRRLDTICTW